MSIQIRINSLINLIREIEADARKAHHLANHINQYGACMEKTEDLYSYARNTLAGINQAEREALLIKVEIEKEESK